MAEKTMLYWLRTKRVWQSRFGIPQVGQPQENVVGEILIYLILRTMCEWKMSSGCVTV